MKNKIIGFGLILIACAIIYAVALWGPFGKHVDLADFFRGFAIGVGVIFGACIVAIMVRRARQDADTSPVK